jgi:hypothetical protein
MLKRTQTLLVTLALIATAIPVEANANDFGRCASQSDLETKIAACIEASKSTSYRWVLHWVYREMARAHRERGEVEKAIAGYAQSLAAEERERVRREMEELAAVDLM